MATSMGPSDFLQWRVVSSTPSDSSRAWISKHSRAAVSDLPKSTNSFAAHGLVAMALKLVVKIDMIVTSDRTPYYATTPHAGAPERQETARP